MDLEVNNKLDNYFEKNKETILFLKVLNLYWQIKRLFINSKSEKFYNKFLEDNKFIIRKLKIEEKSTKEIIRMINNKTFNRECSLEEFNEIDEFDEKLINLINNLDKGIDNSNFYVDERRKKYKLYKNGIDFTPVLDYNTIKNDYRLNRKNQTQLKKELKKTL